MRYASVAAAVVSLVVTGSGLLLAPVEASTFTSSGVRCTKVGTPGPDVLVGTSHRDVLCGLGGDDVLKGLGGDDLLDGGRGNDKEVGGYGADRLLGGPGSDSLSGGFGSDVVGGGAGSDVLSGESGADVVLGGDGADSLDGGAGMDDLWGQDGNDDLNGGSGSDTVRGGAGTNWCIIDSADARTGCVYDTTAATIVAASVRDKIVDVSAKTQLFRIRVHVTDDTGVARVTAGLGAADGGTAPDAGGADGRLVSGDVRDGVWELEYAVMRWSVPGTFYVSVTARDRLGRWSWKDFPATTLTVLDRNPDVQPPQVVSLLQPRATDPAVDVRTAQQDVVVKARVTDRVSGVWYVSMCLLKPQDGYYTNLQCWNADLVSGDVHDGVWRRALRIPRGSTGGDWNVEVSVVDQAKSGEVRYLGPDVYRSWTNDGTNPDRSVIALPTGQGVFPVRGSLDSTPAAIDEVTIAPAEVDTLPSAQTITVRVHAKDAPGEGVTSVGGIIGGGNPDGTSSGQDTVSFWMDDFTLVAGTPLDGWWEGRVDLPQGTPPGTYYLQTWVQDAGHWRSYVAQPSASDPTALTIPGDSTVTVVTHTP